MSELQSEQSRVKTKEEYSRNVKKLKIKLLNLRNEIESYERKVDTLKNTSNDKMIAMKIAKFCKERKFTPQMLFRFADRRGEKSISKIDFSNTMNALGLKLTKQEIMRLQYLIDEDLSGSISKMQFNGYLDAFGIKKQFTPGETTARQIMQKLDIDKLLRTDSDIQNLDPKKKRINLLNYQDFVKYCHKHYKQLKDKEIATIFERLQRNQLINLQHFIDYLQDQKEQRKKMEEKNKKKGGSKIKKGESMMTDSIVSESHSFKGLVQALLRLRDKRKTPLFHSSEFIRLQRLLNRKRGELTSLFKSIDSKRKSDFLGQAFRGSFGFNELLNFFIDHEQKSKDLIFSFELMGHKFTTFKKTPESMISQYTQKDQKMTEQQFKKFMEIQFEVVEKEFQIISKLVPREQGGIGVKALIELMKTGDSKGRVFIRPGQSIASTRLVFRSGLMALRCCLDLEDKLIKARQTHWDDYQFGPTESDEFGNDSIDLPMPSEEILWQKAEQTGMIQFFQPGAVDSSQSTTTTNCPHELIGQSLVSLARNEPNWLYPTSLPDSSVKQVTLKELSFLFKGVYPRAFHNFAKYGIYVIKVWVQERWRYVVIDDKIPCRQDGKPFFSSPVDLRFSFISLIQKALAKMYGTYKSAFQVNSTQRYLMEMTGSLCIDEPLNESMSDDVKNRIWAEFVQAFTIQKLHQNQAKKSQVKDTMLGLFKGAKEGIDTNFPLYLPLKITHALQMSNPQKKNKHKSHRLLTIRPGVQLKGESEWNSGWSKKVEDNKYNKSKTAISELCQKSIYNDQKSMFINYKLFRKGFNLIRMKPVDWQLNIILRKELEFQEKIKCRYEITAKSTDLELVIYLKKKSHLPDVRIAMDTSEVREDKEEVKDHKIFKNVTTLTSLSLEKDKRVILEFYVQNWKADEKHLFGLTFYFSHPRFELKQRDRHLLFRYVSPFQEESKLEWGDFSKQEKLYIYRHFHKAAEPKGCCGCL